MDRARTRGHRYRVTHRRGRNYGGRWNCPDVCSATDYHLRQNYDFGYTDGFDDGRFAGLVAGHEAGWREGYSRGQRSMIEIVNANGLVVYKGPFRPFVPWEERSAAMKYGGAALAVAGAVVALLWRDGPRLSAGPTAGGGARAAVSIGF